MRILYMGTGTFAVPSLEALLKSEYEVIGVVTQPDRPAGRGRQPRMSAVKQIALDAGIPVYQPEKVRDEGFVSTVSELAPDMIVVAAFGQLIPKSILGIPKFGNVNVHGSLLPKYRGAAPVHYALFNGEKVTGVTTMLMAAGLDTGPMLLREEVEILPDENEGDLEERLSYVGARLLMATIAGLIEGTVTPEPQDDSLATYAPSVKREECAVDWNADASTIVNRARGCTPRPGAYTTRQGSSLKIWACRVADSPHLVAEPGELCAIEADGIVIHAGKGDVLVTEVQPENRKRISAVEFARGYRLAVGEKFS